MLFMLLCNDEASQVLNVLYWTVICKMPLFVASSPFDYDVGSYHIIAVSFVVVAVIPTFGS